MAVAPESQRSSLGLSNPSSPPLLTRADLPWLALALAVAVGLRIAWIAYLNIDPTDGRFDDSVFYHNTARLLAQGYGYADPWGRGATAQWPPAYPAALAVLYKLFGLHLALAKALNVGLAAATVILTYIIARRLFDWRAAFLAALALALFPGQIFFVTLVYTETMYAMVFLLVLLLALVWTVLRPDGRWWQLLLIGLLVGAGAMVRSEGAFLAVILVVTWALMVRPWRTAAHYSVLMAVGVVAAMAPWTVRNALEFHEFIPLRPDAGDVVARQFDPEADARSERKSLSDGVQYQLTHFWEIPGFLVGKTRVLYEADADAIVLMQTDPPISHHVDFKKPLSEDDEWRWRHLANRYFKAIGLVALAGAALCLVRRNRGSFVLIIAALGWTLLFANFNPLPRYHFPVGPIIAIFSAVFTIYAWDTARAYVTRATGARAERSAVDAPADGAS